MVLLSSQEDGPRPGQGAPRPGGGAPPAAAPAAAPRTWVEEVFQGLVLSPMGL
jgi:hypothetical protein